MSAASAPTSSSPGATIAIGASSALVLVLALAASFRMELGEGVAANATRVMLAAAGGGLYALAGALRRVRNAEEGPAFELTIYGMATSAAAGAALGVGLIASSPLGGALIVGLPLAAVAYGLVHLADRPARLASLGAGLLLAVFIAAAALSASFGSEQDDGTADFIAWLLGDFATATATSAGIGLVALATLIVLTFRAVAEGPAGAERRAVLSSITLGFGVGLVGVLGFVGSFVPRCVRALAPSAPPRVFLATSVVAGAATVAAIDAVPRLLIGGYALPFAVSAGMLAVPIYLGWNRRRLRREVGSMSAVLEAVEIGALVLATAVAVALALFLTQIVRSAT